MMEAIDRFVQVVLVEELQKPAKWIVQVWDGQAWSTIREILTTVSNPEWHRRTKITADNVALNIKNMALHFAISEMKGARDV